MKDKYTPFEIKVLEMAQMKLYLVWDELNCTEADADEGDGGEHIQARDPCEAAIKYAENDPSHTLEGLYQDCPQPILVKTLRGPTGKFRVEIKAEMKPVFKATGHEEVTEESGQIVEWVDRP